MSTKFWNKCEDLESSNIGPNCVEVGTVIYEAAKFNNGVRANGTDGGYGTVDLTGLIADWDHASIGFWLKMKQDSAYFDSYGETIFFFSNAAATEYITFWADNMSGGSIAWIIQTAGGTISGRSYITWSSGDLIHFGLTWDADGTLGGTNTFEIYVNNVLENTSGDPFAFGSELTDGLFLSWYGGNLWCLYNGLLDNPKLYDAIKTDWADKDTEGESVSRHRQVIIV